MRSEARPKVLFLCTHNSALSQVAEGLLRHLAEDRGSRYRAPVWRRRSSGRWRCELWARSVWTSPHRKSKEIQRYLGESFEYVITPSATRPTRPARSSLERRTVCTGLSRIHPEPPVAKWSAWRCSVRCETRSGSASRKSSCRQSRTPSPPGGRRRLLRLVRSRKRPRLVACESLASPQGLLPNCVSTVARGRYYGPTSRSTGHNALCCYHQHCV